MSIDVRNHFATEPNQIQKRMLLILTQKPFMFISQKKINKTRKIFYLEVTYHIELSHESFENYDMKSSN